MDMSNLYRYGLEIILMFSYSRLNVNVKAGWNLQVYLISKKLCYEELRPCNQTIKHVISNG